MSRRPEPVLYPSEEEIAAAVLGDRARDWPRIAPQLEREGLPKVDPMMGARHWPSVVQFFSIRAGERAARSTGQESVGRSRVRIVPYAPDGEEHPDAQDDGNSHGRRRLARGGGARPRDR